MQCSEHYNVHITLAISFYHNFFVPKIGEGYKSGQNGSNPLQELGKGQKLGQKSDNISDFVPILRKSGKPMTLADIMLNVISKYILNNIDCNLRNTIYTKYSFGILY